MGLILGGKDKGFQFTVFNCPLSVLNLFFCFLKAGQKAVAVIVVLLTCAIYL